MELNKIEFYNDTIHLVIDDLENQISYSIELDAGDFFEKIASAFYSARAVKPERDDGLKERD